MNILIADDDVFSRALLNEALKSLGHEVTEAGDGTAAMQMLEESHFPVVISDWLMPGMTGIELCRWARERDEPRYTYFILLTMLGGKENYIEAMTAGADDFITKPFDRDQLEARLHVAERILRLQSHTRTLARLIPLCSVCKRIRNDSDYWQQVDQYLMENTEALVSHGICPDCFREKYPQFYRETSESRS